MRVHTSKQVGQHKRSLCTQGEEEIEIGVVRMVMMVVAAYVCR